ncbi:hypothetical protein SAMN05192574_12213 [Mucilaginibacter gossypiicola]|uniref:Lipoprotein n=1 Tax=Mucilaginibacter gossypiicola TaxID=551995 RepID=A0A1H8V333_9SPHI|nr:hypothetical protein [Mucilaginibacter gossypiicola]SEP09910.1 hypothetical protein SAMN05192574_12213 [Mucilaginibacter gossypiicola]
MPISRTRFLLLSSCLFILTSCTSVYKSLKPAEGNVREIKKFAPDFTNVLYKTEVDVIGGHHLSGLLLIKTLPDKSVRMVFSNEMGFKFFDFEFKPDGSFKVYYIIKQMDKRPVIITLQKDFELVMMRKQNPETGYMRQDDSFLYYVFPQEKGANYYITNKAGTELIRMERSSDRKPVVQAIMHDFHNGIPDTIGISHKNFKFNIGLKRLKR